MALMMFLFLFAEGSVMLSPERSLERNGLSEVERVSVGELWRTVKGT